MEKAQRRVAKMIKDLENQTYEKQLRKTGKFSLHRRLKEDIIAVCKYIKWFDKGNRVQLFSLVREERSSRNWFKLQKGKFRLHMWEMCFSYSISQWNKLLWKVTELTWLQIFQARLNTKMLELMKKKSHLGFVKVTRWTAVDMVSQANIIFNYKYNVLKY